MAHAEIYAELKRDHDKHRDILNKISNLRDDVNKRRELFEGFRLEVQSHAAAEEESLYATMLGKPDLRDDARHSVAEHKEIDDLIGELLGTDIATAAWEDKFAHMRHRYEHHIDEEEEEMFPAAERTLDGATEERLAETYEARKPAELEMARANPPGGDERE